MIYTEKDNDMFDSLKGTALGVQMIDYLQRLQSHVCDSRTWGEGEDKVHANKVSGILEEHLIKKITQTDTLYM